MGHATAPFHVVVYDAGAVRGSQVSDDKAIVGVEGEGEVVRADAWEIENTKLGVAVPTNPQAIAGLGDAVSKVTRIQAS